MLSKIKSRPNKGKYEKYKNKLTTIIRVVEKSYYNIKFNLANNNISNTWKFKYNIINSDYNYNQTITEIVVKNEVTVDKNIVPNTFNEYFINIGPIWQNIFLKLKMKM